MSEIAFLTNLGVALTAAFVGGALARALGVPVLVGYLLAGIAVGPHTPGFIVDAEAVRAVARLGVILLLFAVGVQSSVTELAAVGRLALLGGGLQIGGTILLGLLVGVALGWGPYGGLFLGCTLSLSSTAVMMHTLEGRGELGTAHGLVLLGILVLQDLSLVVMISLLPALATVQTTGMHALVEVGLSLLRAGGLVAVTVVLALRWVPALLERVARLGSQELFLLAALCICLAAGALSERAGLSLELGAFLAGLVISEEHSQEVLARVRPLRDVFASLFFVSVGMLLDPLFVLRNWPGVLAVVLAVLLGKTILAALAVWWLGAHGRTALLVGLGLAQIGEFSFVLAGVGYERGLIPAEISGVILATALITILPAPFLYGAAEPLYARLNRVAWLSRWLNRPPRQLAACREPTQSLPRVLILGSGRVGSYVSEALRSKEVPHAVVDYDAGLIARLRSAGVPAFYGDATAEPVLANAIHPGLELAIVALPEARATQMAVRALKRLAPELPVVARVHREEEIARIRDLGAEAVIHAEFEAALAMVRQGLDRLGFPAWEVESYMEEGRQRYRHASERRAAHRPDVS